MMRPREFFLGFVFFIAQIPAGYAQPVAEQSVASWISTKGNRKQGEILNCHVFVATALLEAALYRQYDLKIRLSEADLFVRGTVTNKKYYAQWEEEIHKQQGSAPKPLSPREVEFQEVAFLDDTIKFALKNGIATNAEADYAKMMLRYRDFKKQEMQAMKFLRMANQNYAAPGSNRFMQWYYNAFVPLLYDASDQWVSMRTESKVQLINQSFLLGVSDKNLAKINQEREVIRRAFQGFRLERKSFFGLLDRWKFARNKEASSHPCSINGGREQTVWIKGQLRAGRPVAVNLWEGPGSEHGGVIIGYSSTADKVVYQFLDSDAGIDSLPQQAMCRVSEATVVITPNDPPMGDGRAVSAPASLVALAIPFGVGAGR